MSYFPARQAQTTLPCPACGAKLDIERSCHAVSLHCPACRQRYPLKDFIAQADKAMEDFLENIYCDRI